MFRSSSLAEHQKKQAALKANLIVESYNYMGCSAFNIGWNDLALGKGYLQEEEKKASFPFLSANILDKATREPLFRPYVIQEINGLKVGIFGLITDKIDEGVRIRDQDIVVEVPLHMAEKMVKILKDKSDLIIAMASMELFQIQEIIRNVEGIDLIFSGSGNIRLNKPRTIHDTVVLKVPPLGRYLGKLDLFIHEEKRPYKFVDSLERSKLEEQVEALKADMDTYYQASNGKDPFEFYKEDIKTINKLRFLLTRKDSLEKKLESMKDSKNTFSHTLIPLDKHITNDTEIQNLVDEYKKDVKELQMTIETSTSTSVDHIQPEKPGKLSFFVSHKACKECHPKQHRFWEKTKHATAYQSLVEKGQQFNPECVGCHTTGYRKQGGFWKVTRIANFKNVQCEECHGPGSRHQSSGNISKVVPESVCITCHNKERSPHFEYTKAIEIVKMNH